MSRNKAKRKPGMYRIITGVLTVVILAAVIIWYAVPKTKELGTSGSPFDEVTVLEDARQIARLMGKQDYDTILNTWGNDTLRKALDDEKLKSAYQGVNEDWGNLVAFGEHNARQVTQMGHTFAMISIRTSYENTDVILTMTFDRDMKLAGLYLK